MNFYVKLFRFITLNRLPKMLRGMLKVNQRPIFLEILDALDLNISNTSDDTFSEAIDSIFGTASNYLKISMVSYLQIKPPELALCKIVTASSINKVGNESEKKFLGFAQMNFHKKKRK